MNFFGSGTFCKIRSENADMSNDKSCETHDRRMFKGFCVQYIYAE
ncbi:MAG: hypothetical protein NVSMB66_7880 [Candidatus Doudnabacteria bacterium]